MAWFAPLLTFLGSSAGAATVATGASVIGGFADRKQRKSEVSLSAQQRAEDIATIERHRSEDIARQTPEAIRASMESAGFNPLMGVDKANAGVGSYGTAARSGVGYGPTFGSSVANAMSIGLDGFQKEQVLEIQRTQLDLENKRLNETIRMNRLNPKVGGIYGSNRSGIQSLSDSVGRHVASSPRPRSPIGSRTGPIGNNKNESPLFTLFGVDMYGSGAISNGETFEAAIGETTGAIGWLTASMIASDAIWNTSWNAASSAVSRLNSAKKSKTPTSKISTKNTSRPQYGVWSRAF